MSVLWSLPGNGRSYGSATSANEGVVAALVEAGPVMSVQAELDAVTRERDCLETERDNLVLDRERLEGEVQRLQVENARLLDRLHGTAGWLPQ